MSKRAKRGGTLDLPVPGRVAICVIAAAALGYSWLSRPVMFQPVRKPPSHQISALPTSTHVPSPIRAALIPMLDSPTSHVEIPKASDPPGAFVRQVVDYVSNEPPGTVIIDTGNTFLYLVLNGAQAMRYGIGVGRQGFTWSGEETVARKTEWPDWRPPAEMLSRQPYLPRFMAGGPGNPLGARAMYLGETEYRIHGTNKPDTIGKQVSSGCIRLTNEDITDLYQRVKVGAKVVVLSANASHRPSRGSPDVAHRPPDPPPNAPSTVGVQLRSVQPKLAEAQ